MSHLPLLVRREFWEHRSFFITPAIVAAIMIFAALINHLEFGRASIHLLEPEYAGKHYSIMTGILAGLALPYMIAMGFLIVFYLLDSLYADRKDRSVLFWKSLPVSDTETVLSKLIVAGVVLPAVILVAAFVTSIICALIESVRLSGMIENVWRVIWLPPAWFSAQILLLYCFVVMILWYLPILAWLMLASAWARRAVILWAILPPLMLVLLEDFAFNTNYVANMLRDRFLGWFELAIRHDGISEHFMMIDGERIPMTGRIGDALDPGSFFSSPGLWIGLVVAAAFLWGAILLRRRRSET
jgi:ABC-2 type transport system permease protein